MDGWKAGDASACASIYSEDADVVDFMGQRFEDRAAIQESIVKTLEAFQGSSIQLTRTSIHTIKPDLVAPTGTGRSPAARGAGDADKRLLHLIIAKAGDSWHIISTQAKVPPSMPPSP